MLKMHFLFLSFSSPHPRFDADRLQPASSLLSFGHRHMYSPISIETNEPDFNKAIASVIWSRHHGQATCTIFNCGVANCPLCPTRGSMTPRPTEVEGIQRRDSPKTNTRRSTVVNWLVSSTSSPQDTGARIPQIQSIITQQIRPSVSAMSPVTSDDIDCRSAVITQDKPPAKRRRTGDIDSDNASPCLPNSSAVIAPKSCSDIELSFTCHFCPKRFAKTSNFLSHLRTHTGDRPFKCPSCPKSFAQRTSLRTHLRTHTGDRPYQCVDCNQRFGDLSTLTKHRRTHTGEKPYRCHHAGCGKAFAQSGNLKRHFRTHGLDAKFQNISA